MRCTSVAVVLIPIGVYLTLPVGPRWQRILSVSAVNMPAGSTASLSLSVRGNLPSRRNSPQHRPMVGELVLTVRSALSA